MALDRISWASEITRTNTSAEYTLGELREYHSSTYGEQIYRYIKNGEAATSLTAGGIVQHKAATDDAGTGLSLIHI